MGTNVAYAIRWLVFAPLLVQGILRYEIIELDTMLERWIPRYAGMAAFAGGVLVTGSRYGADGAMGADQAIAALGIGLGCAFLAASAARKASLRWLRQRPVGAERAGRMDLYRAALESAFARGEPGPELRRRLDRQRRALGVPSEEAMAMEHIVTRVLAHPPEPLKPGDEPMPGLVVDRLLGEGSEGRVLLAHRLPAGTPVVVKELRARSTGSAAPLRAELDRLRRVRHPTLPRLLDVHLRGEAPLLVFEYVAGQTLEERLAEGALPADEAKAWIAGALEPLGWLHAQGMVHRDLKPAHLIRGPSGGIHLLDLGLLGRASQERDESTISGLTDHATGPVGTLAYMAPEVARGQTATAAADLYALGLVAYRMLAGHAALDLAGLDRRTALHVVAQARIDLRDAPAAWRPWLRQALHPLPASRFADAAAMKAALPSTGPAGRRPAARSALFAGHA